MENKKKITPEELGKLPTCIRAFMADRSNTSKSFFDLLKIFNDCYETYYSDESCDIRILGYESAMENSKWKDGQIVIEFDVKSGEVTDGIHRGIAYLRCIASGKTPNELPPLIFTEK